MLKIIEKIRMNYFENNFVFLTFFRKVFYRLKFLISYFEKNAIKI